MLPPLKNTSSPSGYEPPVESSLLAMIEDHPTTLEAALKALDRTRTVLEARNQELEAAKARERRLNAILRAIRNINRCITEETDRNRLIRLACESLTETLGYLSAWIVAMEPQGNKVLAIASSGVGSQFKFLVRQVRLGVLPKCLSAAIELDDALLIGNPFLECGECPLSQCYEERSSLSHALRFEGAVYGSLVVSVPKPFASDPEELDLFRQVSRDLGFALHKIHAAKKSSENAEDLRRAQQIAGIGTWRLSRETNLFSASEEAKKIYGFCGDEWTREEAASVVVPSYRNEIELSLDVTVLQGGAKELVYEINRLPDGSRRVIHSIAEFDQASNTVVGTIQDITDLRHLEMEKLIQERYLRTILQTTADGFFVLNRQGLLIEVNEAFCRMQGAHREMLLGRSIGTYEAIETPEQTRERIERIIANGFETFQTRHRRIDGSEFPVEVTATWVDDMGGQFVCFCRDITKRARLDQRVRSLSEIMNTAPTAIYVMDLTGRFLWVNQAAPVAHGYDDTEDFLKLRVQDIDDAHSAEMVESRLRDVLEHGEARFEVTHRRKDGSEYPAQIVAKRIEWEGEPAILSIATNISDRVGAEEALRQSERGLRSVFRSAPVGIGVVVDRVFTKVNDRLEEISGYGRESLIGRSARMLYPTEEEYQRVGREKYAQIAESHTGTVETQWVRKDGRVIEVLLSSTPIDLEDYTKGITFTALDITTRKNLENRLMDTLEELRVKKEMAESANRAKDEFLAVMSHEMRTPLNAILGFASLMQADNPPEEWRSFLDTILDAGERQLQLIDNILNYAQLDRGSLKPNPETLRLRKVCQDALRSVITMAHGLELKWEPVVSGMEEISDSLEVRADRNMLTRLLLNLLGNACKYTKQGSVTLAVGMSAMSGKIRNFRFEVRDTGIGIGEEQMNRLFLPFSQVDSSLTRKFEGAGLGLAICNKLVHILGGEIGFSSELGHGSLFWFSLPLEVVDPLHSTLREERRPQPMPKLSHPVHVLIVEDRPDNVYIVQTFLRNFGATSEVALRGVDAVAKCEEESFDLILMDLCMPDKDGFETAGLIREGNGKNHSTPIVAITADATRECRQRARDTGMQSLITKPIRHKELFEVLRQIALEKMALSEG